jgi:hypothetical protein
MKNLFIFVFFISFISCNGSKDFTKETIAVKEQNPILKRYDVKSGMVTYKITISGKVMGSSVTGNGIENLYFKNWGAVELIEENITKTTKIKFFGKEKTDTQKTHIISKLDNEKSYNVDFENATIYLRRVPAMEIMKSTKSDAGYAGKSMLESMGGKKIGEESLLGYPCEIWDTMGSKQWIYKGVTLKMISKIMGITTIKEAVTAKFNQNISDKYFKLPDFPITNEAGYLSDTAYQVEQQEIKQNMQEIKNMSFSEFKQRAKQDPELKNSSDKELKLQFKMMKKMLQYAN